MVQKTIKLYLFFTLITKLGISFVLATYVMFLLSRGLNIFEVNLINFVFVTVLFICEIPTGILADIFGRKLSFVMSSFFFSLGMIIYALSYSLWGFILGETLSAIGAALASGAFHAWLVDKLEYHNFDGSLEGVFSRGQRFGYLVSIVGALAGGYFADMNLIYPWIFAGIIMFIAGILSIFMIKEEYFVKQDFHWKEKLRSAKETVKFSFNYIAKNKVVRFIIILSLIQYFSVQAPNMQWQPYFSEFIKDKFGLGVIFSGTLICMAIGATLAARFLKLIKNEKTALFVSQIIIAIGIIGSSYINLFPLVITAFMFHEIGRGLFQPLKDVYLNKNIPSKQRATLISFESMSRHIGAMSGLLVSGLMAQASSISFTWLVFGVVLLLLSSLVFRNTKK